MKNYILVIRPINVSLCNKQPIRKILFIYFAAPVNGTCVEKKTVPRTALNN